MNELPAAEEPVSVDHTTCCVVGAGPAGAILSLLLARAGVSVTLLESHADFDRDFRGDTIHPSTLELLDQLGLTERLHALPHGKVRTLRILSRDGAVTLADLGRLKTAFPYIMTLPQSQLLELLTAEAARYPTFRLVMQANVQRLVEENGKVQGVRYRDTENQWHEVRAELTVACDGRFSKLRKLAGIETVGVAPPMDVIWFRLPKYDTDDVESAEIHVGGGRFAVVLDRGNEWQIGYVILKGTFAAVREAGIESMREGLAEIVPWLGDRVNLLTDWKQMAVLNVESSRAPTWHKPGLLLIGDAAHVMSPVGGVGINVAVQDAVETANLLTDPLRSGRVSESDLAQVQRGRQFAVKVIQRVQRILQDRIAAPGLHTQGDFHLPWLLRLMTCTPVLRNLPARMIAFGPRRVHLRDVERSAVPAKA